MLVNKSWFTARFHAVKLLCIEKQRKKEMWLNKEEIGVTVVIESILFFQGRKKYLSYRYFELQSFYS